MRVVAAHVAAEAKAAERKPFALAVCSNALSHDRLEPSEPYRYHGSPADNPARIFIDGCE
jgi:hypothetical protein